VLRSVKPRGSGRLRGRASAALSSHHQLLRGADRAFAGAEAIEPGGRDRGDAEARQRIVERDLGRAHRPRASSNTRACQLSSVSEELARRRLPPPPPVAPPAPVVALPTT
jgi:hypothetical protein